MAPARAARIGETKEKVTTTKELPTAEATTKLTTERRGGNIMVTGVYVKKKEVRKWFGEGEEGRGMY